MKINCCLWGFAFTFPPTPSVLLTFNLSIFVFQYACQVVSFRLGHVTPFTPLSTNSGPLPPRLAPNLWLLELTPWLSDPGMAWGEENDFLNCEERVVRVMPPTFSPSETAATLT